MRTLIGVLICILSVSAADAKFAGVAIPPSVLRAPPDEFPAKAASKDLVGAARVQLTISASGQLLHCSVVKSSGDDEVDMKSCEIMKKAKYKSAMDADGNKVIGVLNQNIVYLVPDKITNGSPPVDLELVVAKLPPGDGFYQDRTAALTVDATGKVESCEVLGARGNPDALSQTLCKIATTQLTFQPALDEDNRPVRSIQAFAIEFSVADAPLTRKPKR